MIWNDSYIRVWAENDGVDPYDPTLVNPTSLDLRLGDSYREFSALDGCWSAPKEFKQVIIAPGTMKLFHSVEFTRLPATAVAFLFLKSSMGRKGIEHLHAGFGDAGFEGQWTFELMNCLNAPVVLEAGQPICQLAFMMCMQPTADYRVTGHYCGQTGPACAWDEK